MNEASQNPSQEAAAGCLATALLGAGNLLLLGILSVFVWLKETPLFWRNAGGWPIWLRELVFYSFYPFLGLEFLLFFGFIWTGSKTDPAGDARGWRWGVALFFLLCLGGIVGYLVSNNIYNLLHGYPLHWHRKGAM